MSLQIHPPQMPVSLRFPQPGIPSRPLHQTAIQFRDYSVTPGTRVKLVVTSSSLTSPNDCLSHAGSYSSALDSLTVVWRKQDLTAKWLVSAFHCHILYLSDTITLIYENSSSSFSQRNRLIYSVSLRTQLAIFSEGILVQF